MIFAMMLVSSPEDTYDFEVNEKTSPKCCAKT